LRSHHVEAQGVDVEHCQRFIGHGARDRAVGAHFGEVAHAPQQPVDDARACRATAARSPARPGGSSSILRSPPSE
jgi:hypothetical protein